MDQALRLGFLEVVGRAGGIILFRGLLAERADATCELGTVKPSEEADKPMEEVRLSGLRYHYPNCQIETAAAAFLRLAGR